MEDIIQEDPVVWMIKDYNDKLRIIYIYIPRVKNKVKNIKYGEKIFDGETYKYKDDLTNKNWLNDLVDQKSIKELS